MPSWMSWVYPQALFRGPEKGLYLTFDDGPHPVHTPWVLDQLKKWEAKATFFCLGRHVRAYPEVYDRILREGHRIGNHTHHHLNGWRTGTIDYIEDIRLAQEWIASEYFRPPYGRITPRQARLIRPMGLRLVLWDIISGDFDQNLKAEICAQRVISKARTGSIVVFHDSEKAWERLKHSLPAVLSYFSKRNWCFHALP